MDHSSQLIGLERKLIRWLHLARKTAGPSLEVKARKRGVSAERLVVVEHNLMRTPLCHLVALLPIYGVNPNEFMEIINRTKRKHG